MKRRLVPLLIAALLIMTAMWTTTALGYENAPAVQNDELNSDAGLAWACAEIDGMNANTASNAVTATLKNAESAYVYVGGNAYLASNVENADNVYTLNGVNAETTIIEKANLAQAEVSTAVSSDMAFLMEFYCATSTSVNTSTNALITRATTAVVLNANNATAGPAWSQFADQNTTLVQQYADSAFTPRTATRSSAAIEGTRDCAGIHSTAVVLNDSANEKAAKKQATNEKRTDVFVDTNGVIRA
ncbi:hypothetical protein KKA01_03540 [Patescibacteria group bacterium]|nr:hypothetical protein [Patescibacteria group bacterium]